MHSVTAREPGKAQAGNHSETGVACGMYTRVRVGGDFDVKVGSLSFTPFLACVDLMWMTHKAERMTQCCLLSQGGKGWCGNALEQAVKKGESPVHTAQHNRSAFTAH